MKFMVGLQLNDSFVDSIIQNKQHIHEVYFSWGDFANGRNSRLQNNDITPWEAQNKQIHYLKKLHSENIALNILFNANCYGKHSLSRAFFNKIGDTTDYILNNFGLSSITTTSPIIAKFFKANFKELEIRASVNMKIGTVQGMDYLSEYFDSYYMQREYNRDFNKIKELKSWCDSNGKKLYMLANSGCLNHCSAHTFHDNLVSHEADISKMDNAYVFSSICKEYLKTPEHHKSLIYDTNFIRPEDIKLYEPYFNAVKLATRVHKNPNTVLNSYVNQKYSGNILELLEPAHSIYPYIIENGNPLKLINLEEL